MVVYLEEGMKASRDDVLRHLVDMLYQRNDVDFYRGEFRVRGDVVDVFPNPFNSSVVITVETQNLASLPTIAIYDLRGNVVYAPSIPRSLSPRGERDDATVWDGSESPSPWGEGFRMRGKYIWQPDKSIASGIYLVRATTEDGQTITKRIVYLK